MLWPQRTLNLNILLNQFTSSSKCNIGTRQGELFTPMLFSLYINYLYSYFIIIIIKTLFNEDAYLTIVNLPLGPQTPNQIQEDIIAKQL